MTSEERRRFDTLYRRHFNEVVQLLRRRLDNPDDVQELAQEAFLRILRYQYCGEDSLKYLLLRTALNLAASHRLRACATRAHVSLDDLEPLADACSLEDEAASDQRTRQMVAAIGKMPARCREVFLLRLIHGLRQREIADRCGISTRRVEQHLAKAQVWIRKRVLPNGS